MLYSEINPEINLCWNKLKCIPIKGKHYIYNRKLKNEKCKRYTISFSYQIIYNYMYPHIFIPQVGIIFRFYLHRLIRCFQGSNPCRLPLPDFSDPIIAKNPAWISRHSDKHINFFIINIMKASKLNTTKIQSTPSGEFTTYQALHMLKTEQNVTVSRFSDV